MSVLPRDPARERARRVRRCVLAVLLALAELCLALRVGKGVVEFICRVVLLVEMLLGA